MSKFDRNVICSKNLVDYVKKYNILFYFDDVRSPIYSKIVKYTPHNGNEHIPQLFIRAPDFNLTEMKFYPISGKKKWTKGEDNVVWLLITSLF